MKKVTDKLEQLLELGGTKRDILFLVISAIALLISIFDKELLPFDPAWVAIILCGIPIILEAIIGLVTEFDIKADVLVSLALIASVLIREDFAAGEVAFIMQLGGLLEELTVAKARAGIEKLVQSADAGKAKIVGLADRWATWIVVIALTAAALTWLISGEIIRAVTILVVFCPCALVLATPTAIMAAIGNATKHGFLVREGDAPALKKADVGIAMGGVGSDIAVDAADIALVDDEVKELPHLIALSKRMMITIKCNLSFSMGLNFLAIVLAITGILNPVVGALVHNAGSVVVIINSALLLKWMKY